MIVNGLSKIAHLMILDGNLPSSSSKDSSGIGVGPRAESGTLRRGNYRLLRWRRRSQIAGILGDGNIDLKCGKHIQISNECFLDCAGNAESPVANFFRDNAWLWEPRDVTVGSNSTRI
jgi:hypothetical protein